ncbi:hypothetical protein [Streptomyces sp. NBC_01789]|uniref:hypothetical protein n=1 Tax=Streptomyces sp. NBC_01789 TaxID=2975941 RepID=UPI002256EC4E|nr:hypothetical protein [Streptomyces sp. NBC_01789]MCX4450735.1 hypothetical protein [Streptomyces sp. NBC_01789]
MTLELRQAGHPKAFKLYEGEDWIGDIEYYASEGPDDEEFWTVKMWSLQGTGKEWGADSESFEEAVQYAHMLYDEEFVPERRKLKRPTGDPRPISTPMGGQRRH